MRSPLPPPSYSEATTDPLTTDGFGVSPMTTTSSPVVFNVSVSPMATPITSRSMETLTQSHLTDSETYPSHPSTTGNDVARRADSDCLPQAVIPDGLELALVEYSNNRDNLPIVHTPQSDNTEYFSGLEVVPVQRSVNSVTPLHLLGDQPESIDCPFCLRRSETRVKKKPSSTTQYVITSSARSQANSDKFTSCCAVDDNSLWSSCSLYSAVVFQH